MTLSLHDEDVELVTPVHRSLLRSVLAKLLFLTITSAVLLLVAAEISMVFHVAWLDSRPLLASAWRWVVEHLPLDKLPRIFGR